MSMNIDLYNANSARIAEAANELDTANGAAGLAAHGISTLFDDTRWDAPSFLAAADLIAEFRSQVVRLNALFGDACGAVWIDLDRAALAWGVS